MNKTLRNLIATGIILGSMVFSGTSVYAQEGLSDVELTNSQSVQLFEGPSVAEDHHLTGTVTIYRLYNSVNGEHLYTSDAHEKDVLYKQRGWGYEGEAWYAPTAKSGTPVYRLYNPKLLNHLYTTDTNEVKTLTTKYGWIKDNNGKPVFYSGGSANIYRVYNAGLQGLHHWTTDSNEYKTLPKYNWKQEGVKLRAIQSGNPIKTQYYKDHQNIKAIPSGKHTIDNTSSKYAIEADVTLKGSGTGRHAKLVIASPTSAVSFGLQYDAAAREPHTGKNSFMIENISHNNVGGQSYHWTDYYGQEGVSYHLMLILHENGRYEGYINGAQVIIGRNPALAGEEDLALRVEGAARKSGDSITATFKNIKLKKDVYRLKQSWLGTPRFNRNNGLVAIFDGVKTTNSPSEDRSVKNVTITGILSGIPQNADWDTAGYYDKASALAQFYN